MVDRPRVYPAWGQTCKACGKQNHFEKVCWSMGDEKQDTIQYINDEEAAMDFLIKHMAFDPAMDTYNPGSNNSCKEFNAVVIPFSLDPRWTRVFLPTHSIWLRIYPDRDATICLGGPKHLQHMGLSERILVPSRKKMCTIGGFSLVCQGWLPVTFKVEKKTSKQELYICRNIIYFSKAACIDVGIFPPCFPKPMTLPS